jgi:FMN phosphatase YigB (HAD superfamily)
MPASAVAAPRRADDQPPTWAAAPPRPDTREALCRLVGRFTIAAVSDGNLSMLTDMFAPVGLTWHCVLSGEMVHAYKPDPAVYRLPVVRLALDPRRTLMLAAHPWDLRAAAAHGLRTAYIQRAGEGEPAPSDIFDLTAPDLAALATRLLNGTSGPSPRFQAPPRYRLVPSGAPPAVNNVHPKCGRSGYSPQR